MSINRYKSQNLDILMNIKIPILIGIQLILRRLKISIKVLERSKKYLDHKGDVITRKIGVNFLMDA